MVEPRYLPPRRPARGAVLRASPVSSASFVSTFLPPCPSLARVATRWTCSAVLAIFSGGGRSTDLRRGRWRYSKCQADDDLRTSTKMTRITKSPYEGGILANRQRLSARTSSRVVGRSIRAPSNDASRQAIWAGMAFGSQPPTQSIVRGR